jgi:hypothetical protein
MLLCAIATPTATPTPAAPPPAAATARAPTSATICDVSVEAIVTAPTWLPASPIVLLWI